MTRRTLSPGRTALVLLLGLWGALPLAYLSTTWAVWSLLEHPALIALLTFLAVTARTATQPTQGRLS